MTISKETLPTLAEGIDWTMNDALIYREQLLKDAYLKNTALKFRKNDAAPEKVWRLTILTAKSTAAICSRR